MPSQQQWLFLFMADPVLKPVESIPVCRDSFPFRHFQEKDVKKLRKRT